MAQSYRFDRFVLDPSERRLTDEGQTVEVSGRYLDALVLLVAAEGRLVTKTAFLEVVWKGVPVTDEALTQCIRSLRRALGDAADRPRFIETVPRHGYRFIAPVTSLQSAAPMPPAEASPVLTRPDRTASCAGILDGVAGMGRTGMIGGGLAGLVGGLLYGFAGVPDGPGGAVSGTLVLAALTAVIGLIGGAGVGLGIGAAAFVRRPPGPKYIAGGAAGGLLVGAVVHLAGSDAFALLFGSIPAAMTGAGEGLVLGGAIGAGTWIAQGRRRRFALVAGATAGGLAGCGIALGGGRLMGGSLAALAAEFPAARLRLDPLGALFGEPSFGPVTHMVITSLEGALFGAAMVLALGLEHRRKSSSLHRPGEMIDGSPVAH